MPQALPVQSEDRNTHLGHPGKDLFQHRQPAAQLQHGDRLMMAHQWLNYASQGQSQDEYEWQDLNGSLSLLN